MIKAAFFDIDGTLLSFETHLMPASTKAALAALREQGIKVVISSGRPIYQMPPCTREGFDAYITMNGSLCFDGEGVYHSTPIDRADADAILDQVEEGLYDVLVLQRDGAFANRLSDRVRAMGERAGLVYAEGAIERARVEPVYQFCVFVSPGEERVFMDRTKKIAQARWCDIFCDAMNCDAGKDSGVKATLKRFGISPDEAIAFGDGGNDVPMFNAVGTSVAMGNAYGDVRDHATYVTDDVDHDGIYNACKHFGLI